MQYLSMVKLYLSEERIMRAIKEILYGTEEYAKTLALRNKVMRIPLGLNIYEEDFLPSKML